MKYCTQTDVDNVRRTLDACSKIPELWHAGITWYDRHRMLIAIEAAHHGLEIGQCAAMFAILSPQRNIDWNIRLFRQVVATRDPWSMPIMIREMEKLHGCLEIPECAAMFASGRKVSSFMRNLLGDYEPVTIDSHSASNTLNAKVKVVKGLKYDRCEEAIQIAAKDFNLEGPEAQGAQWAWERMFGQFSRYSGMQSLFAM